MSITSSQAVRPAAPAPVARVRAPGWRDPRLLLGLVLVFASVAIGARVIAAADHTVPVFAARRALPTGTALTSAEVSVVRLRLTGTSAAYLPAAQPLPAGQVLLRPVGAGELVPVAALASAIQVSLRPVAIPLQGAVPAGLRAGGLVDVWASAKAPGTAAGSSYLDARRIAVSAEVSQVQSGSTGLAAGSQPQVQILLGAGELPAVLNALANDAQIAVLPVPGALPGPGQAGG